MRAASLCLVLALGACGGSAPPGVATPEAVIGDAAEMVECEARQDEAEEYEPFVDLEDCADGALRSIATTVQHALRQETLAGDFASSFTADSTRVFGREARPGGLDVELTLPQAAARVEYLASLHGTAEPDDFTSGFPVVEIRREGDEAQLSADHLALYGYGEDSMRIGVDATLVRDGDAWRIRRLRTFPKQWAITDEFERYDADWWTARDREAAAARVALGEVPGPEPRRALVEALLEAMRWTEAMEALGPLLEGEPNVDDLNALHRLSVIHGRIDEARAAKARADDPATPIRTAATFMRRRWCTELPDAEVPEEELDSDDPESHCVFEVLADLRLDVGELRGVALVRRTTGPEEQESVHLITHDHGHWDRGVVVSDGPFVGNQTDGVARIDFTDVALEDLDGEAPPELRARYERERLTEGDSTVDAGHLVCALGEPLRCAWLAESYGRERGGEMTRSEFAVDFAGGRVRVRRRSGPAVDEIAEGTRPLGDVLAAD